MRSGPRICLTVVGLEFVADATSFSVSQAEMSTTVVVTHLHDLIEDLETHTTGWTSAVCFLGTLISVAIALLVLPLLVVLGWDRWSLKRKAAGRHPQPPGFDGWR